MNQRRGNWLAGLLLAMSILFFVAGSMSAALGSTPPDTHRVLSELKMLPAAPESAPTGAGQVHLALWLLSGLGLVGMAAGTVTYRCPASVAGTTTAPTAGQVANCVIADVAMADAWTATTITHNLTGVSTNGADGSPMISIFTLVEGATPVGQGVTVTFTTTGGVVLTALTTAAGNGATYRVQIWRHAIITDFTH